MEVKPGYKQTEVGVIPEDWGLPALNALVDGSRGIRYGIVQPGKFDPKGRYMVRGQDYSKGWVDPSELFRVSAVVEEPFSNARVRTGDILVTIVGASTGRVATVPSWLDGANLTQTTARVAINNASAVGAFCCQVLSSWYGARQVQNYIKGGAQPGLNCGDIEKFLIPLPPTKAEQEAIAGALSDADALIESLVQLLVKKRHLKQGAMQELLTGKKRLPGFSGLWEVKRLGDIVATMPSGIYGVGGSADGRVAMPVATTAQISDDDQWNEKPMQVRFFSIKQIATYAVQEGDLVVVKSSGSAASIKSGKLGLVTKAHARKFVFSNFLMTLRPKSVLPQYLYFYLTSHNVKRLLPSLVEASTYPNIRINEYLAIDIPVPPPPEQDAIAAILSDMDAEVSALEAKLTKDRQIKQGMMQELLTGRIRLV